MAFGNGLDMRGHVDTTFRSKIKGGIWLIRMDGGYTGPGGVWREAEIERVELKHVNVQSASDREIRLLVGEGGTAVLSDFRVVHINDGMHYLEPDESGEYRDQLEFWDGAVVRRWRVMDADNRPWRNFCRAVVELIREPGK
ncbi:hypothetical protein FMK81_13300 [Klebsiella oxytoca]|uniref:hypothetical protein n=1 Tax=Klebsiella oxytoca TaxID=571 RepID=UPI001CCEF12B|nr:hypothetical protein [Klebsiella oxytoca]MBZ7262483.1 hypothetical protein [Klebsiella oxytoca]